MTITPSLFSIGLECGEPVSYSKCCSEKCHNEMIYKRLYAKEPRANALKALPAASFLSGN